MVAQAVETLSETSVHDTQWKSGRSSLLATVAICNSSSAVEQKDMNLITLLDGNKGMVSSPSLIQQHENFMLNKEIKQNQEEIQAYLPKKLVGKYSLKSQQNQNDPMKLNQHEKMGRQLQNQETIKILPKKPIPKDNLNIPIIGFGNEHSELLIGGVFHKDSTKGVSHKVSINGIFHKKIVKGVSHKVSINGIFHKKIVKGVSHEVLANLQKEQQKRKRNQEQIVDEELEQQKFKQDNTKNCLLSKDSLCVRERENACKGPTHLLLLAEGNNQQGDNLINVYEETFSVSTQENNGEKVNQHTLTYPNMVVRSNEAAANSCKHPPDVQNLAEREQDKGLSADDDDDRNNGLVIIESDETSPCVTVYESLKEDSTMDEKKVKEDDDMCQQGNNRSVSKQKMKDGELWLFKTFMVIGGSLSVIKLSDIEESYLQYCQDNNKEPLATPVLARLIHSLFPSAEKCRLGPRGNQRIHYRKLIFKSDLQPQTKCQTSGLRGNEKEDKPNKFTNQTSCKQQIFSENQISQQKSSKSLANLSKLAKEGCIDQQINIKRAKQNEKRLSNSSEIDEPPPKKQTQNTPEQINEESCKAAAKKLNDVLKWITSQGETHKKSLLRDFAHSASCQNAKCLPVCLMFRRVRRHVVAAQHSCSVLRLYSLLLHHHVSSCASLKCGLPACPALRATRIQKCPLE